MPQPDSIAVYLHHADWTSHLRLWARIKAEDDPDGASAQEWHDRKLAEIKRSDGEAFADVDRLGGNDTALARLRCELEDMMRNHANYAPSR